MGLITRSKIKSMPVYSISTDFEDSRYRIVAELLHEFGSLEGVAGFYAEADGTWMFDGTSGFLIPLYDMKGNMYRLRLRLDHPEPDETARRKTNMIFFPLTGNLRLLTAPSPTLTPKAAVPETISGFTKTVQKMITQSAMSMWVRKSLSMQTTYCIILSYQYLG